MNIIDCSAQHVGVNGNTEAGSGIAATRCSSKGRLSLPYTRWHW